MITTKSERCPTLDCWCSHHALLPCVLPYSAGRRGVGPVRFKRTTVLSFLRAGTMWCRSAGHGRQTCSGDLPFVGISPPPLPTSCSDPPWLNPQHLPRPPRKGRRVALPGLALGDAELDAARHRHGDGVRGARGRPNAHSLFGPRLQPCLFCGHVLSLVARVALRVPFGWSYGALESGCPCCGLRRAACFCAGRGGGPCAQAGALHCRGGHIVLLRRP